MSQSKAFSQVWDTAFSKPVQVNSHKSVVKRNIYFEVINDQRYLLDEYVSEYAISELKKGTRLSREWEFYHIYHS